MRVVIQRVCMAEVEINNSIFSSIKKGLLIFIGIEENDTIDDIKWLTTKIINLRIFADKNGKMNMSIRQINGELLVVSQFTLYASVKKGNRPSYLKSAKPEYAIPLYREFIAELEILFEQKIHTGEFGADMKIHLINDGPVTIIIDSKNKE